MFGFVGRNGAGKPPLCGSCGVMEADVGELRWCGQQMNDGLHNYVGHMLQDHGLTFSSLFACLQATRASTLR
jgi:ABC-type uncharacterized transport system ATPase subunit